MIIFISLYLCMIKTMKYIIIMLMICISMLFFACGTPYDEVSLKKRCEATPCMDSLCLHWNPELKRCGTSVALNVEWRIKKQEQIGYLSKENDSLEKEVKYLKQKNDSLLSQKNTFLKENIIMKNDNDSLKKEKDHLQSEKKLLKGECDKAKKNIDDLQRKQTRLLLDYSLLLNERIPKVLGCIVEKRIEK